MTQHDSSAVKGHYTVADLQQWNERILQRVAEFGLKPYPQEFEICDYEAMLSYMVYSGMPSHYPHWSYGKNFEKLKTLYEYGVTGLPYEMVINSNPSIAYLMRDNSLALQILTMAHVYGHNDFFRNNFTFRSTRAEFTLETFKTHADRVRSYVEDPSIGLEKVERILDAGHALSVQCRRNLAVRKLSREEQRQKKIDEAQAPSDPFRSIHRRSEYIAPDLHKVPLEPDEDVLLFIRDHNQQLADWERDLLTIVHEETQYFLPQIETKIMNEGWASFWHKRILESLDLPQDLQLEFLVRHAQVLSPSAGGINPYHLGFKV
ncbi:MAG TPA: SpoVR family protein, partial [Terriglobales bacterium]|nr:SpoVR family protein [Terriglobales bacterium]